jgi:hypothetical protein
MTFVGPENCPNFDRVKRDYQQFVAESVFEVPQMVDKRPWLAHAFTELMQVQHTGKLEHGIGDFRVTDDTLNMAGRILGSIRHRYLPSPSLSALSGGGVQIIWSNGAGAVEVSVFPHEGVGVARLVDDVPVKAVELGAAEYAKMNEFLAELLSL